MSEEEEKVDETEICDNCDLHWEDCDCDEDDEDESADAF